MKIGIVGAGLIGGSIIQALFEKHKLYVVTRNQETRKNINSFVELTSDDISILSECETIFVCTPMNKTLEVLDNLEEVANPNTIVADVSSLKSFVLKKQRPYQFIGTHPMAGTEHSGYSASFKELFYGAKWVVTPAGNVSLDNIKKLQAIIAETGAKPITMNAEQHDKAVALISHMPMLISQALMGCAENHEDALLLASSGFRDMTRLSLSNTEMANDMIRMNNKNIKLALNNLIDKANALLTSDYKEKIEEIKEFRKNMYDENGINRL